MRKGWMGAVAAALTLALLAGCGGAPQKQGGQTQQPAAQTPAQNEPAKAKQWKEPPAMKIDANKQYTAKVETSLGSFTIELFAKDAPKTVNNFVFLAREGFYDGITFHRIIQTFMIQGGDPTGTGGGSPGYRFADELPVKRSYEPGIVAMANAGPNTNGSQFFICTGPDCKSLDKQPNYTQFGKVSSGMDVVQKLAAVEVGPGGMGEKSKPKNPPTITKVTIEEK